MKNNEQIIYLAGGCFWGMEKLMSMIPGVTNTTCGYANADVNNPSYEQICQHQALAKETVKVAYDNSKTTLESILRIFFLIIDPTIKNQQGNDIGPQYQTGIYYIDDNSYLIAREIYEQEKTKYDAFYVEFKPLENFYDAENYHQKYLQKNPDGYCHIPNKKMVEAIKQVIEENKSR
ncbi:MAG: peptide-methionine (S)-S-oxide reductase MsrA [Erysipelotrichaceae bacterium]